MPHQSLDLYDYQTEAVQALREGIRAGHRRQMLCAPTGSGKSIVATYLLREAASKLTRCAMTMDRISLVDQMSAMLDRYGIAHGVIQGGHWRRRPYERVQIASEQTLEKRGFYPDLSLLVLDEAHVSRRQTRHFVLNHPELTVVGLSATPFTAGLSEVYTNLVNVRTTNQLIAEGRLAPLKMYAAVSPDMTGAKVVAGEWTDAEIEQRGRTILGDIVSTWREKTTEHFGGPVKTIVFAASVAHGEELCRQFQAAGFNFQQISYKDGSDTARRAKIDEFRKPDSEIIGLVACEVFSRGFDVPDILCGISARPYRKSLSSHVQQLGRVMRSAPDKKYGIWLDHSGNCIRFGKDTADFFENGLKTLSGEPLDSRVRKEPTDADKRAVTCACGCVLSPTDAECPACGKARRHRSLVETAPGSVIEIPDQKALSLSGGSLSRRQDVYHQLCHYAMLRKKGDVTAARKFAGKQYQIIFGEWPNPPLHFDETPVRIDPQLRRTVIHNLIKLYAGRSAA